MAITAQFARHLALSKRQAGTLSVAIEQIDQHILRCAEAGQLEINDPHVLVRPQVGILSKAELTKLKNHYENQGFRWIEHAAPLVDGTSFVVLKWEMPLHLLKCVEQLDAVIAGHKQDGALQMSNPIDKINWSLRRSLGAVDIDMLMAHYRLQGFIWEISVPSPAAEDDTPVVSLLKWPAEGQSHESP